MLTLKLRTTDEHLISLTKAYWLQDSSGKWLHKITALETMYNVPKGRVHAVVSGASTASDPELTCPTCSSTFEFTTRSSYEDFLKRKRIRSKYGKNMESCGACLTETAALQKTLKEAKIRAHDETIKNWLAESSQAEPSVDYAQISLKHAFLLDGLLRYAGDSWRDNQLDAWTLYKPKMCDTEEDIRTAYFELSLAGLLIPAANSPLDAFIVFNDQVIGVDELRVNWIIAADKGGAPCSALLRMTDDVQKKATPQELRPIWEWVSLCELRSQFSYCHDIKFKFRSKGWTDAIETSLLNLLAGCSLNTAKTVMWKCFNSLAVELQKRDKVAQHVYNMIPGSFQRTFDFYQAQGWKFFNRPRRDQASEPIYTGHLFDRILGGGTHFYNALSGDMLEDCCMPKIELNRLQAPE